MESTAQQSDPLIGLPALPTTSWVVLGMLAFGEELSGYDLKKWADWSVSHFYWSPSFSQIYSELKRLENHGLAVSRVEHGRGLRGRRVYRITEAGQLAVRDWAVREPIDQPILKHGVLLRVWLGHISNPDRLKAILTEHIADMDDRSRRLANDVEAAAAEPAWAFPRIAMRWSQRYYAAERDLALGLLADIDEAQAELAAANESSATDGTLGADGFPTPQPGRWREVEALARDLRPI